MRTLGYLATEKSYKSMNLYKARLQSLEAFELHSVALLFLLYLHRYTEQLLQARSVLPKVDGPRVRHLLWYIIWNLQVVSWS